MSNTPVLKAIPGLAGYFATDDGHILSTRQGVQRRRPALRPGPNRSNPVKTSRLTLQEVETMPERSEMEDGVLYVSRRFSLAIHLCACGCRAETVTPLEGEGEWSRLDGEHCWRLTDGPTMRPSIGNQNFPCRSHYWVTDGRSSGADCAAERRRRSEN